MIRAKRIYEPAPKKEEQVDLQKIIADAFQSSISKAEKASTGVSMEIERENKIIEKILYRIDDKLKSMKIDKAGVTEDVYNQLSSSLQNFGNSILDIVDSNAQTYLTSKDKEECISIAETMVNEAVEKFDSLFKPFSDKFLRELESKADKEHSHDEFEKIMREIEENEDELEQAIEKKADKEHNHEMEDITGLSDTLKDFAKKDHKHDEYATVDQLNMVSMQRVRGAGGGGHVVQDTGVVKAQRSNLNFIGATVTDDPDNNATVVTITDGGGGGASSLEVTQNAHGFVDLDWLYFDTADNTYKKAQSNSETTLGMWHVVEVVDTNTFKIAKDGVHEIANALAVGEYVLSPDTAGGYTQTIPGDLGDLVLYGMEVLSATEVSFYTVPAIRVGAELEGTGTTNELAYWVDANTVGALPVATYPSLTELSYVKGVTSAIQTQLDAKIDNLQEAFVAGTTITVANTDNQTLTFNQNDTTNNPTGIQVTNLGTGSGIKIDQTGAGTGLRVDNASTQRAITVNQNANTAAGREAFLIYSNTALTTGNGLSYQYIDNASSTIPVLKLRNDGSGDLLLGDAGGTTVFTLTAGGAINLGHATDTTISRVSAGKIAVEGVNVVTTSSTDTLTNKTITKRVTTITSSGTPTINTDNCDCVTITALAEAITSMTTNLSGTPTDFQSLIIRIKDNGTARAITWGSSFEAKGVALPTTTVISKVLTVGFLYDTVTSKRGCIASAQEA